MSGFHVLIFIMVKATKYEIYDYMTTYCR